MFFGYHSWRGWLLLASNRGRPGMLLSIPVYRTDPKQNHQCQSVPHGQSENPALRGQLLATHRYLHFQSKPTGQRMRSDTGLVLGFLAEEAER